MLGDHQLEREAHERHVREYARYLKVPSVVEFPELRSILDEGLSASLPQGWRVVLNDYGSTMYFHEGSGACRTDHPMDEVYRNKCLEVVLVLQNLRREEEEAKMLRGVNAHVHAIGAEFDAAVGGAGERAAERGDSDWSLLEEEFGPATPVVPPVVAPLEVHSQQIGIMHRQPTEIARGSTSLDPRSEAPEEDDELIELDFPEDCPTTATSNPPPHPQLQPPQPPTVPPLSSLPPPPEGDRGAVASITGVQSGDSIPTSVTSRNLRSRMTNTVNREELLEVQRQVETMKALNEAMRIDLEETKQEVREVKSECPEEFICPITGEVMVDPVVTADGFTYERVAITKWLKRHDRSPCTNQKLDHKHLISNLALKSQISTLRDRKQKEGGATN